jgi:hypothetical protein
MCGRRVAWDLGRDANPDRKLSYFTGVPYGDIDKVWPYALPWIEDAAKRSRGRFEASDTYKALVERDQQLWISINGGSVEACCVTEIVSYARKKYCRILIGTGRNREHWQEFATVIEEWAKSQGCHGIESIARKGWWKVFSAIFTGWSLTHVFIEKEF